MIMRYEEWQAGPEFIYIFMVENQITPHLK